MEKDQVKLVLMKEGDKENFIKDNQTAFNYGAMEEFGLRNDSFEEDGEIISSSTIENAINKGTAYRIVKGNEIVGGTVVTVSEDIGELSLLFINPNEHNKGIGGEAWLKIEKLYSQVNLWKTITPYFETRNIHFYVNKCGFKIVEFFNKLHPLLNQYTDDNEKINDEMFLFEKKIKR